MVSLRKWALVCLYSCLASYAGAQARDRIYVHSDKSAYVAGEAVWFKAYLFSGLAPGSIGTNLFVDLVNEAGTVVTAANFPILGGAAFGDVGIPLHLSQGIYFLRAYTKTQLSKEHASIAVKQLYVVNSYRSAPVVKPAGYQAVFRPSSGYLATGLENLVYVHVTDTSGHPSVVDGQVWNNKNEGLSTFKTDGKGRARFVLTPVAGEQYTAAIKFTDGTTRSFPLPVAQNNKVIVAVSDAPGTKLFQVSVPEKQRNGATITVQGFMDDNLVFEKKFAASTEKFSARVPVAELPMGLLQLIVTDQQKQKIGEAVTWVTSASSLLPVTLKTDTLNFSPNGNNVLSLSMPDSTLGTFSVSITDPDKLVYPNSSNIISGLLLNQDSYAHSYDDNTDISSAASLDLAIGTAAWLDQSVFAGKQSVVSDSDYITIRGKVVAKDSKKKLTLKDDLTFIYTTKDSTTSYLSATPDKDGGFVLQHLAFKGRQSFRYSLNGNRWNDIDVLIDTTERKYNPGKISYAGIADRSILNAYGATDYVQEMITTLRGDSLSTSSTGLKEVVVRSKIGTPLQQVNDRYARGVFNSIGGARVVDMLNEPPPPGGNILDYLAGRLNGMDGLNITIGSGGEYVVGNSRRLSLTGNPPTKIYLNEQESSVDILKSILASDVALVKYYPPGRNNIPGVGIAAVMSIYTKKPEDGAKSDVVPMGAFTYNGYSETKDFTDDFLPREFISSKRNTIYWNANLVPEEGTSLYKIRFPNSSSAKRYHVVIEGFTIDGRLLHIEKVLEK